MLKFSLFTRNPWISVSRGRQVAVEPLRTGFNRVTQVLRDAKAKYFVEKSLAPPERDPELRGVAGGGRGTTAADPRRGALRPPEDGRESRQTIPGRRRRPAGL